MCTTSSAWSFILHIYSSSYSLCIIYLMALYFATSTEVIDLTCCCCSCCCCCWPEEVLSFVAVYYFNEMMLHAANAAFMLECCWRRQCYHDAAKTALLLCWGSQMHIDSRIIYDYSLIKINATWAQRYADLHFRLWWNWFKFMYVCCNKSLEITKRFIFSCIIWQVFLNAALNSVRNR